MTSVPDALAQSIRDGSCVAFVGAGFSAPELPAWGQLLRDLAALLPQDARATAEDLVGTHNEEAAQLIRDELGDRFEPELARRLAQVAPSRRMERRKRWLRGIPFRCILTTNYDEHLQGRTPSADAYRALLRPDPRTRWWNEQRYWTYDSAGPEVLQLHGSLRRSGSVVLARQDYRRQLYLSPGYATFLRSIFASHTILYLGISFHDVYLNELRSEVLALLGHARNAPPTGYAILPDIAPARRLYYRDHEGIEILPYHLDADHTGFDTWLEAIHDATNPRVRFGRNLAGKRILWLDPNRDNNDVASRALAYALATARTPTSAGDLVVTVGTSDEALQRLASPGHFDLVITHWGHERAASPTGRIPAAIHLLTEMRRRDLRCPVIAFSTDQDAAARRAALLELGALGYHFTFEALLRALDALFTPATDAG